MNPVYKIVLTFTLSLVSVLKAQDSTQTLFKLSKIKTMGFYMAPEFQMANLNQHAEPFRAVSAMLQFNQHLAIGYSFFNSADHMMMYRNDMGPRIPISLRAGAFKIEYALKPASKLHVSFPLLVGRSIAESGYGVMPLAEKNMAYYDSLGGSLPYMPDYYQFGQSRFVLIQPGMQVEANVFKIIKVYLGMHYRFSIPLQTGYYKHMYVMPAEPLHPKFVSGLVLNTGIKIGLFEKSVKRK
jgi:hypothetical protein